MPHRPSAKKRLRQNEKRRLHNRAVKSRLRTEENKFNRMVLRGTPEDAAKQLALLTRMLHRAAARNVVHRNLAARKQAKFQRRLDQLRTPAPR